MGHFRGAKPTKNGGIPPIFCPPSSSTVAVLSLCKVLGQAKHDNSRIRPLNFADRKKSQKFRKKNSPEIQGGPQHDQFRNLSSPRDPASRGTKIVPLTRLGAEKLGVKILTLTKHFWKRGPPPPILALLKSPHRAL